MTLLGRLLGSCGAETLDKKAAFAVGMDSLDLGADFCGVFSAVVSW